MKLCGQAAGTVTPVAGALRPVPARADSDLLILLIDDDPDCRQMVRDALEIAGIKNPVREVSSGAAAIEYMEGGGGAAGPLRPGLIYLDMEMPGLDGLATLGQLRQRPELSDVPIVVLSGASDDRYKRAALRLGANSFTSKANDPTLFRETIRATTHYWTQVHQHPAQAS
jgi:CheY-like chemotaxis protein